MQRGQPTLTGATDRELGHRRPAVRGIEAPHLEDREQIGDCHQALDLNRERESDSPGQFRDQRGLPRRREGRP
eukprot:339991-Alexandrium_andersonii.AAC.1